MGRTTFNYEEARRLRAQGVEVRDIAAHFGVSKSRIYQVCHPDFEHLEQERKARTHAAWQTICHYCGGLATFNPYGARCHPVPRCRACFFDHRRARGVASVRPDALRCSSCQQWLPDEAFPRRVAAASRRYRHAYCRDCCTAERARYRASRRVPCRHCGKLRTNPRDNGSSRRTDTGLCRSCYQATVRLVASAA